MHDLIVSLTITPNVSHKEIMIVLSWRHQKSYLTSCRELIIFYLSKAAKHELEAGVFLTYPSIFLRLTSVSKFILYTAKKISSPLNIFSN